MKKILLIATIFLVSPLLAQAATLSVQVSVVPFSGQAPLNDVDVTISVSGTATGIINYKIDCQNDGLWEKDVFSNDIQYVATDVCDYANAGIYLIKIKVEREGLIYETTLPINVISVPTPTPTPTPATPVVYTYTPGTPLYIYPPTVDIKANNSDGSITIPYGTSAYLYWSASNALSCWASNAWSGLKSDFGSESTGILTTSKIYTITCLGQAGSASDSVTVNISPVYPELSIKKSVRNVSQNTPYQDMVYALPGENLSFKIEVELVGSQEASNVSVRDILPTEIIYQGNLRIDDQTVSGDIANVPLGIFVKNQTKIITFDAQVVAKDKFGQGLTALTNQAGVKADGLIEVFDPATVNVNNLSGEVALSISKMAKNITKGDTEWKNEIISEPGDTLQFQIKIINTKTAAISGVKIKDILHSKLVYSGNLSVDGIAINQDIGAGLNIGDFSNNQTKTITFEIKAASESNFNYGANELINIANVYNDDFSLFATAKVIVTRKGVLGATDVITGINVFYIALAIAFVLSLALYFLVFYLDNSPKPLARKIAWNYYKIKSFMFR